MNTSTCIFKTQWLVSRRLSLERLHCTAYEPNYLSQHIPWLQTVMSYSIYLKPFNHSLYFYSVLVLLTGDELYEVNSTIAW